jgi:hypothetical protein
MILNFELPVGKMDISRESIMILFELFEKSTSSKKIPTTEEKRKLLEDIRGLDKNGKEKLYALIRYSALLEEDKTIYTGTIKDKGAIFDFDNFPDRLQKVVRAFVDKHKTVNFELVFE